MKLCHILSRIARDRGVTFYLIVDNASSHVLGAFLLDPNGSVDTMFQFQNLTILFLPPNATSHCQPCDMGIVRSFKARFRRHMLQHLM